MIQMIDDTILYFAEELSRIGLNDEVNLKNFWDKLSVTDKRLFVKNYTSNYLKDLTSENVIENIDKILYYIRKGKIDAIEMRLIVKLFKDLEACSAENRLKIKKYRMLIIDAYNATEFFGYSPIEASYESFSARNSLPNEIVLNIEKFQHIYQLLIDYIDDNETRIEESFQNIVQSLDYFKINKDKYDFLEFILIINNIVLYHFRTEYFFNKIEKILNIFKDDIKKYNKFELINIFEGNPWIFLYLIRNKIIEFDYDVYNSCFFSENKKYFCKECLEFKQTIKELSALDEQTNRRILNNKTFDEKRIIGENENEICRLIRNDSIEDFVSFINDNEVLLDNYIRESEYETNMMLRNKRVSLIQYAAFFGSFNIFKYIHVHNRLTLDTSIWEFAIHGRNPEIINYIENEKIKFDATNIDLIETIIKCSYKSIYEYFINKYYNGCDQQIQSYLYEFPLKYRNYFLISKLEAPNKFLVRCINEYNLYKMCNVFAKNKKLTLNEYIWRNFAVKFASLDILELEIKCVNHPYNKSMLNLKNKSNSSLDSVTSIYNEKMEDLGTDGNDGQPVTSFTSLTSNQYPMPSNSQQSNEAPPPVPQNFIRNNADGTRDINIDGMWYRL